MRTESTELLAVSSIAAGLLFTGRTPGSNAYQPTAQDQARLIDTAWAIYRRIQARQPAADHDPEPKRRRLTYGQKLKRAWLDPILVSFPAEGLDLRAAVQLIQNELKTGANMDVPRPLAIGLLDRLFQEHRLQWTADGKLQAKEPPTDEARQIDADTTQASSLERH